MSLLALLVAAQASFITAPVTPDMAVAAVDECARQLRAGTFDHARLTDGGWVSAVRSRGGEVDIQAFRHPDNMILLSTIDKPNEPDLCTVMAPIGQGLNLETVQSALRERWGVRPRREDTQSVWEIDDLRIALRPMGGAGVVIELSPRSTNGDSGRR
jgi:hypothetical protein